MDVLPIKISRHAAPSTALLLHTSLENANFKVYILFWHCYVGMYYVDCLFSDAPFHDGTQNLVVWSESARLNHPHPEYIFTDPSPLLSFLFPIFTHESA